MRDCARVYNGFTVSGHLVPRLVGEENSQDRPGARTRALGRCWRMESAETYLRALLGYAVIQIVLGG